MHPHIERLLRALDLEELEQTKRYALDRQQALKVLKSEGLALHPITVTGKTFGYAEYPEINFRLPFPAESGRFRNGMSIECFCQGEEPVRGIMLEMEGRQGAFRLLAPDFPDWIEDEGVGIKLAPDTKTTDILRKSLAAVSEDKRLMRILRRIHREEEPVACAVGDPALSFRNPDLNASQRSAVNAILENEELTIVHGPPGTGKTTTLAEGILQLIERGGKILVTAPSNTAVDNLSSRLVAAGVKLLRVGNTGKVDELLFPHTPEGRLAGSREEKEIRDLRKRAEEFRRMALRYKRNFGKAEREQRALLFREVKSIRGEIRKIRAYNEEKLFAEADVIAGTPVGLHDALPQGLRFRTLVMDEAGQCMEPYAWCVFPLADTIVLAGDHCQLPPTVLSTEAAGQGLARSVLESAVESGYPLTLLNVQYRMRMSIAGFSSDWFYGGLLGTALHLNNTGTHLTFIDTAGTGYEESAGDDGSSLQNEGELGIASLLIERNGLDPTQTAFISPYAGQVAASEGSLAAGIRKSTVDSFQGQETENVVLSLVRSNEEGEIGFLKDHRRMNVAMTRARERLYVIGDSATIGSDPFYRAFLEYVEKAGEYGTAWEYM